jgi:hypothetical protein
MPAARSASTASAVSHTGDWHASGRSRSPSRTRKRSQPARPRAKVSSSKPWPSAASITSDQTHGGWIPPHEPSASCRAAHPALRARDRARGGAAQARPLSGSVVRPPISLSSIALGRTGRSASTTESATIVCRAQQAKS